MRTIAQAITDLATKAKGSQAVPRGRKITDALDALADAMAGTDVPLANCTTIVNAIDTVTANYGGGGVTLGDAHLVIVDDGTVQPGDEIDGGTAIMKISVGDAVVTDMTAGAIWQNTISTAATGATVDVFYAHIDEGVEQAPSMRARTCTVNSETHTYVTISDTIELEYEEYAIRDTDVPAYVARFVMPEIPEGSALLLAPEYV